MRIKSLLATSVFLVGLLGLPVFGSTASATDWLPVLNADPNVQPPKWDWQLKSPVKLNSDSSIGIYDIDMFDNETNGMVGELKGLGKNVICYVNVGAWEDWRDDASQFPASILGSVYDRFPNERWLDIRDVNPAKSNTGTALRPLLEARFDRALQMGCDAVEPDNMDGFDDTSHNPSGFPLTYEDQIYFNLWISEQVRERGMAIGFKNNTNQALDTRMVNAFDFVVTESCVYFNECDYFNGFLAANKPVFLTEYLSTPEEYCPTAKEFRISGIQKRGALGTFRLGCDDYYDTSAQPIPTPVPKPNPLPTTTPNTPAINLLTNGDFETGVFAWDPCGDINNIAVSNNASQGQTALSFFGGAGCVYQEVPVNADEEYSLSCEAKRPGTPWSIVQLSYLDAQYNNLMTDMEVVSTGGPYSTYTLTGTAPVNTSFAVALLYSEDQMLVDNCVLSSAATPEPAPQPNPSVTNLLPNGDFENGVFGWQPCGDINGIAVSSSAHQGTKAINLSGGAACMYYEVPVDAGQVYTMSCEASQQGSAWGAVEFSYLDSQFNSLSTQVNQVASGGDYSTYTSTATAPANTSYALVLLYSEDNTLFDHCVVSGG